MKHIKISDTEYRIEVFDWDIRYEDYIAGSVKRNPNEDNDSYFWRFYPANNLSPLNGGQLRSISEFIFKLNKELD